MGHELHVPFSVLEESSSLSFLFVIELLLPFFLELLLLSNFSFMFGFFVLLSSFLLPIQDIECSCYLLFLLYCLSLLSVDLLVVFEHPEFGVDLLLKDLLFELCLLIHELLFSFDLSSGNHESGFLLSELISFHFKLSFESLLDLKLPFFLSLSSKTLDSLGHLGSDLFEGLKLVHEFFLILLVLCGKKSGKLGFSGSEVGSLSLFHVVNLAFHNSILDNHLGLGLPVGFVVEVLIAPDDVD